MKILLTDYNKGANTTTRIYRHYAPFSRDELPPMLVELPGTTTEYDDLAVDADRMIYYRISVVHNGNETVGPLYNTMKRFYTGPQINKDAPDTILRGDSFVGRYGNLELGSVLPIEKALEVVPSCSPMDGINMEEVYVEKCSYNGKIMFVSSVPLLKGTVRGLYNDGALFTSGDGEEYFTYDFYRSIKDKVIQGIKHVTHNGFSFRIRLITDDEFTNLYTKLYPDSVAGKLCDRVINNTPTHNYASPVTLRRSKQENTFKTIGLDLVTTELDWEVETPLYMVVDLLDRGNMAWPDADGEKKPTDSADRMMHCQAAYMNGRAHFFGGLYSVYNKDSYATTRHISFDMDGNDRQEHAPMPVGVYNGAVWTHGNKIYCFGGASQIGTSSYSYKSLYQGIQVWEDDGTPEGTWTTMESSIPYRFVPAVTTYSDPVTGKKYVVIYGGFLDEFSDGGKPFARAELETFDGTWEEFSGETYSVGGGGMHFDGNNFLLALTFRTSQNIGTTTSYLDLPTNSSSYLRKTAYYTQGNEMDSTRYGKMFMYKETIFMTAENSGDDLVNKIVIYQWVPAEKRWLKVMVNAPGVDNDNRGTLAVVHHEGRLVMLQCVPWTSPAFVSSVYVANLVDPLEVPMQSIDVVSVDTSRIFVGTLEYRT